MDLQRIIYEQICDSHSAVIGQQRRQVINFYGFFNLAHYQILMSNISIKHSRSSVVFGKTLENEAWPAKIINRSYYGAYKVKFYGKQQEELLPEYKVFPFNTENIQKYSNLKQKDKKFMKSLKMAEKDHDRGKRKNYMNPQQTLGIVKEEEEEFSSLIDEIQPRIRQNISKIDAIQNLTIQTIVDGLEKNDGKTYITYTNPQTNAREFVPYQSKLLLMKKLEWAILDYQYGENQLEAEKIIKKIFDLQILEPVDYVCSSAFGKITKISNISSEESGKQNGPEAQKTEKTSFRSYLGRKKNLILKGMQAYLSNYATFTRASQLFQQQHEQFQKKAQLQ